MPDPDPPAPAAAPGHLHIHPWLRRAIWLVAGLFLAWVLVLAFRHPLQPGRNTFAAFYGASLAIRSGLPPAAWPPDYIYPPLLAWAIQPLTLLSAPDAFRVWLLFSLFLTTTSMLAGWKAVSGHLRIKSTWANTATVLLAALLLSAGEAKTEWSTAQCDGLTLDTLAFSLALLVPSPIAAGLVIALGANIKYQTIVLVPYLLWRRHLRAAAATLVFLPLVGLLPALTLGWQGNLDAWASAIGGLGGLIGLHSAAAPQVHELSWANSVSIPSALARILPAAGLPSALALPAALLPLAFLLIPAAWLYLRHRQPLIGPVPAPILTVTEWASIVIVLLAFGPQTTRRHFFLLMLVNLVTTILILAPATTSGQKKLLLGALLIFQLGLRLPPSADLFNTAGEAWKFIGGPSWTLLPLLFVLLKTGAELAGRTAPAPAPVRPASAGT